MTQTATRDDDVAAGPRASAERQGDVRLSLQGVDAFYGQIRRCAASRWRFARARS